MTPIQSALQFLAEAFADPAGPQADQLAHAVRNLSSVLSTVPAAANAVAAVRKLRTPKVPAALPAPGCCGMCPAPRPEAGAE
ncbi:hypothetical protein PUR71_09185 [Streptomyces sp. SP17BM10]|uniref:hypothetical protein n=1 Tax=Streptomyces sp. SP17BM10 TaxID=3002530 RepID=UPI002E7875F1|nr:hypothetical protein [Streptomyces sp. SP17BM10]MEE1783089.1 hypothetical protein [Streptomyces sp. SP17BM10]